MEKENKENICVAEFFYLLGLFVVNRTANSPNKSFVLCKYITTVTFHVSSLAKPQSYLLRPVPMGELVGTTIGTSSCDICLGTA